MRPPLEYSDLQMSDKRAEPAGHTKFYWQTAIKKYRKIRKFRGRFSKFHGKIRKFRGRIRRKHRVSISKHCCPRGSSGSDMPKSRKCPRQHGIPHESTRKGSGQDKETAASIPKRGACGR